MRKQFVKTISKLFIKDRKIVMLLGDIGVFGFRNLFKLYSKRIYNIGILEQSMISLAAGLSNEGMKPIVHTIAPFIVNRAYEQLKIDFGYNKLNGNFVSIGASYDYASLGCTHHCPEDINLMHNIPNMQIVVPGNSEEFNDLFYQSYNKKNPTYYRLSDHENTQKFKVKFGKSNYIDNKSKITIVAIGPVLNNIYPLIKKYKINLIYLTTIRPFDHNVFNKIIKKNSSVLIIEPFYSGTINSEINNLFKNKNLKIKNISVPFKFLTNYGSKNQHDKKLGFTVENYEKTIRELKKFS